MTPEQMNGCEGLYASSRYMGAGNLLRKFLGVSHDAPVPLSVAHGVDFGHCHKPMDVDAIEPIHWSCNPRIHEEAMRVKASILAPHPFAITAHGRDVPAGEGVLVIGPPPSPENDERLYKLIERDVRPGWTVLVKARGHYEGSLAFWQSRGLATITAQGPDDTFYERLFAILSRYRTIIGCTFSSALVFAAALGREVVCLRDYFYEAYEPARYEEEVNLCSKRARKFVRLFVNGDDASRTADSRTILGFELLDQRERVQRDLSAAIERLRRPFFVNPKNPMPYKLTEFLALMLKKPGVLRHSPRDALELLRKRNMTIMRINDIDVWLSGKRQANFQQTPIVYQKGVTVPGLAPRGYTAESARG